MIHHLNLGAGLYERQTWRGHVEGAVGLTDGPTDGRTCWPSGRERGDWFRFGGEIAAMNGDGTADINYDVGEREKSVGAERIRPPLNVAAVFAPYPLGWHCLSSCAKAAGRPAAA